MRDGSKDRAAFDRVLMAVAATLLAMSATSALAAPSDTPRATAAELAIDAAIPRPEPANIPPPTASDFKMEGTASVPDAKAAEPKPAEIAPASNTNDAAIATPATVPAATAVAPPAEPAKEPVKAASNVAPEDQPVADKLRDLLVGGKSLRTFDRKTERAAVEKFYATRDYAPVWTQAGKLSDSGKGIIARLNDAASEGLNPSDYPVPNFAGATSPDQLADAELKLTASMLDYARHAQSGRMHWSQVSADILYPDHPTDPTEVLANVTTAKDASGALDSYNPPHKLYRELKAKLAELRGQGDGPATQIAEGPALAFKPATKKQPAVAPEDPRVPQLRAKLGLVENADDAHYDAKVAEAVRKFQDGADLKATGVLDDRTLKAINSPKRDKQIDLILVNMKRWRWLPRQLGAPSIGNAYVILNIPDFTLRVMQNGGQVWTTRVVTGKPGNHATPLLTETMKFITVNPTWNVPPSIINNEYLPALQQDPTALERIGLKLEHNRDGTVRIYQPPGERNALGRIRFNFTNKFLVYQHDTPDKHLFAKETRAYSHGCMRVQNPDRYAEVLLSLANPKDGYTVDRLHRMYGTGEVDIHLQTPIPVHITYQTAYVDDAGKLVIRDDVYGRDARYFAVMRGDEHRVADIGVENREGGAVARAPRLPESYSYASNGGGSVFGWLFGGGPQVAPRVQVAPRRNSR
jgi:murein L,D-transpeptidase YcbB/YkuD